MSMAEIQRVLNREGFNAGEVDGVGGPKTALALEAFLDAHGFDVDVRATRTNFTLVPSRAVAKVKPSGHVLPWMAEALSVMGWHERVNNAELIAYLKSDGGTVGDPAKIAWCGDFVHTTIRRALPEEPFVGRVAENPYLASNWLDFGKPCRPGVGAILSFWRGDASSIYGHLGYYWGEDDRFYYVLGGNQSDRVSITKIEKGRLRPNGSRWPLTAEAVPQPAVHMTLEMALSVNEV